MLSARYESRDSVNSDMITGLTRLDLPSPAGDGYWVDLEQLDAVIETRAAFGRTSQGLVGSVDRHIAEATHVPHRPPASPQLQHEVDGGNSLALSASAASACRVYLEAGRVMVLRSFCGRPPPMVGECV